MNRFRGVILLVVLANIVLVAWLLLRSPEGQGPRSAAEVVAPLVADAALDGARYDLQARQGELNLILISLDALRYDRTGFGGNPDGLTPNLDRFAEEAVVFHKTTAAAPWTLPSHMSIFTGRWPSVHGVTNKLKLLSQDQMVPTSLSPGIETFPDLLIRAGYTAVGFTGGAGVQASYGFGRGFATYLDDKPFAGFDYSVPPALSWLQEHRNERFFMFLHGYDAHGQHPLLGVNPRDAVPDYKGALDGSVEEQAKLREQGLAAIESPGDGANIRGTINEEDARFLKGVYDRKVQQADERVGGFLDQLKAQGLLEKSVVAIISDHGDEFMEHGYVDHGATLCEHQLHTVMLIRFPGYTKRRDVREPVRSLDVFPTLFDAVGLQGPPGVDGQSLLPMLRGEAQVLPVFSETDYRLFVHLRMTRVGSKKLLLDLEDGQRQLFDLATDQDEERDLSSSNPRDTYELEQALRGWMEKTRTNPVDYLGIKQEPIKIF
jgi:choline-sulfatase